MVNHLLSSAETMISDSCWGIPKELITKEKLSPPIIMKRIMALVFAVSLSTWINPCNVNLLSAKTINRAPKAPMPPASVGVAHPKYMEQRMKIISTIAGNIFKASRIKLSFSTASWTAATSAF